MNIACVQCKIIFNWYYVIYRPTFVARSYEGVNNETLWVNETTEYFISVQIFAIDDGTPRRGDYVTFNVSYKVSCHGFARVRVNETDGRIYLEAPGMVVSNIGKYIFIFSNDFCSDNDFTLS